MASFDSEDYSKRANKKRKEDTSMHHKNFAFKKTQRELNQLYEAANVFVKTIRVAKQAFMSGDHNKALLNYNEIA